MSQEITFFDLPSRPPCRTWALSCLKVRMYLNYKGIPYKTQWIEYPDIASTLSLHMKPNPGGSLAPYTIPTVILPDGTYMQDSQAIVTKLEEILPSPGLKIESKILDKVTELVPKIMKPVSPEYLANIPERLLNEASATWWYPDREKRYGTKLDVLKQEKGGAQITQAVAPFVKELGGLLKGKGGPFFEGEQVTWADFVWAAMLRFLERIGQDTFDLVVVEERDVHLRFLEACRPWLARDDH